MVLGVWSLITLPHILIPLLIWSMTWKGLALWAAGKRKEKTWFIVLFLVNTVGILEIIYLLTRKPEKKRRR
jgi:methionyl-tRNA synthetase